MVCVCVLCGHEFVRATYECENIMVYQSHIIENHFSIEVSAAHMVTA